MGPYELAISKISDILECYDLSELTENHILSNSFNDVVDWIIDMHKTLKEIKDIIDNIGGY